MSEKTTLVLGASQNPDRYSYKAITQLRKHGFTVIAESLKHGKVADVAFTPYFTANQDVHTISLYLGPKNQIAYYDYIIALQPKRVIFNPGTENEDLYILLKANNIEYLEACTLVMLSIGVY